MLIITVHAEAPAGQAIGIKEQIAMDLERYGDAKVISVQEIEPEQMMIGKQPSADVAPVVHGKWLEVEELFGDIHWKCSACGIEWCFIDGTPEENGTHYCPNCGAKMDGTTDINIGGKDNNVPIRRAM